jgi:hypothetical protein
MGGQGYPTDEAEGLLQEQTQNAYMKRFDVMATPSKRDQYAAVLAKMGEKINPEQGLMPIVLTQQTTITFNSTAHPGLPTSLDVITPQQTLSDLKVEDPVFLRKITYTINTCVFLPGAVSGFSGPPPAPPFEPQVLTNLVMDPADYIYIQTKRPGGQTLYQDNPVALKQWAGDASNPYFWSPIPIIPRGGQLILIASIMPPGQQAFGNTPPFIDRIAFLQIAYHGERFAPLG